MAKDTIFYTHRTLNCRGRLLHLDKPQVMGIFNITPDSFFEGSRVNSLDEITELAGQMLQEGAAILDLGPSSSRPGAEALTVTQELNRLLPPLEALVKHFPQAIFSVDTYHSKVARAAVHAGAHIINDISSGDIDEEMIPTVAELGVPYVMMHMQGTPQTMHLKPEYKDVVKEVMDYFSQKINFAVRAGIHDIIIDPGFGFGKTYNHSYQILQQLELFQMFGLPVMAGMSRKSMIGKVINQQPAQSLNGTTVVNTIALLKGAKILRVHDVKAAKEAIEIVGMME
ncbi:MAG: dihydropteroate synthase [Bacteroidia bacterium]